MSFIETSTFHLGTNDRGWRANLEWLLQDGKAEECADKAESAPPPPRKPTPLGAPGDWRPVGSHRSLTPEDIAVRAAWEETERFYARPALDEPREGVVWDPVHDEKKGAA